MIRCYEIVGYWPPAKGPDGRAVGGGRHVGALVLAVSASRAAAAVEAKFPGMRIDGCNCKGDREVIVVDSPAVTP